MKKTQPEPRMRWYRVDVTDIDFNGSYPVLAESENFAIENAAKMINESAWEVVRDGSFKVRRATTAWLKEEGILDEDVVKEKDPKTGLMWWWLK